MSKFKEQIQLIRESIFKGASEEEEINRNIKAGEMKFKDWMDEKTEQYKLYLNEDGTYDYDGSVVFTNSTLTKLPIKFNRVGGNFDVANNKLTTLEGSPDGIDGYFECSNNMLTSLNGCPKTIPSFFACSNNQLISLEGGPIEVNDSYYCCYNDRLTSLKGCPEEIGHNFTCCDNHNLMSLEYCPKIVYGNFTCRYNGKRFTEKEIRAICDVRGKVVYK